MISIAFSLTVDSDVESVWNYLADYRNVPLYVDGIVSYKPVGATSGVGAEFDSTVQFGPTSLSTRVVIDEWDVNRVAVFTSRGRVVTMTRNRLTDLGNGQTQVDFEMSVSMTGPFGPLSERAAEPFLRRSGQRTSANIARLTSKEAHRAA